MFLQSEDKPQHGDASHQPSPRRDHLRQGTTSPFYSQAGSQLTPPAT